MIERFERQLAVTPSLCDSTARLGIPDTLALFMDIAAEHSELMGLGGQAMLSRGLFWLTVRTKARFLRRPGLMERLTAATWPAPPGHMRCLRYYTLSADGVTVAEGKTEWAVLETGSGGLHSVAGLYPQGLGLSEAAVCNGGFARMTADFSAAAELESYRVRSTDIDLGGHMNNVAYVRALLGALSSKELEALDVRELDVCYRAPCYEGETLSLRRAGRELAILRPDGAAAVLARLG